MQKILNLTSTGLNFIDYDLLTDNKLKIYLIIDEKEVIPESIEPHIGKIYRISNGNYDGPLIKLNEKKALVELKRFIQTYGDNFIITTFNERNVLMQADFSQYSSVQNINKEHMINYCDKSIMKRKLRENNIRTPLFLSLKKITEGDLLYYFDFLVEKLGLPFILKPKSSAGSYEVRKINSKTEFLGWHKEKVFSAEDYEAEEFIEGKLFHCDIYKFKGKTIFAQCNEYTAPNMQISNNKIIGSLPLLQTEMLNLQIIEFTEKILSVLGSFDGATHTELFITNDKEIIFLEAAARPPGSFIMKSYESEYKKSFANIYLETVSGTYKPSFFKKKQYAFWAILPQVNGVVSKLNNPNLKSEYSINWNVSVGDKISISKSVADIAGHLLVHNKDYKVLKEDFEYIKTFQAIQYANIEKLSNFYREG